MAQLEDSEPLQREASGLLHLVGGSSESIRAEANALPFPKQGIKLSFFRSEFIPQCGGEETLLGLTTTEVCDVFVKPLTSDLQVSYCELLEIQQNSSVGIATVFISHAWKYKFLDVIEALDFHFRDNLDVIVWFDLFSNNQHQAVHLDFHWWCNTFKSAIEQFGHTVMVFAPWNDPIPLTRAWCLFELYCTVDTKSKFEVALSRQEQSQFLQDITTDTISVIKKMLATINVEKSECWKEDDRERIFTAVQTTIGFNQLNNLVFDRLRQWVIDTTLAAIKGVASDERMEIMLNGALAALYKEQGKVDLALPRYQFTMQRCMVTFGEKHHETLSAMNNLALCYGQLGRYTASMELLEACLAVCRQLHGDNHTKTIATAANLGSLYQAMGQYDQAEVLFEESMNRFGATLGETHNSTLTAMSNLAVVLFNQGKITEAEPLYVACYERRCQQLGESHPDTLTSMNNLACLYDSLGRIEEATHLYTDCLERRRVVQGDDNMDTLTAMFNLACFHNAQGRLKQASELYVDCLAGRRHVLGEYHNDTLTTMYNLGSVYISLGKLNEAEAAYQDCLAGTRILQGELHPETIDTTSILGDLYLSMKRFADAEKMYTQAIEKNIQLYGSENHPAVQAATGKMVLLEKRRQQQQQQAADPQL